MAKKPARATLEAVAEVCTLFRELMRSRECDLLCRMATHTYTIYGSIADAAIGGDTPEKVSDRVRFIREYRDKAHDVAAEWENFIRSKPQRKRKGIPDTIWMCVRCGNPECAGAVCAQLVAVNGNQE